jgi:phosphoribosylamine-glycine ligase
MLVRKRSLTLAYNFFFSLLPDVDVKDHSAVCAWCVKEGVSLVIVGPEDPLAAGIADHLTEKGLLVVVDLSSDVQITRRRIG